MNNIEKDQNKEENLLLLFSQKTLYNKSKSIKYFVIFLAIVNFLLGIVSKIIDLHKEVFIIIIFIIILISKKLNNISYKYNDLASATQELIDRKLYGFKIESRFLENHNASELISVAKDLKEKYPQKYLTNISNSGTDKPNGVKNWYIKIYTSLTINEAILKCQKQNIYWDKYLIKCYENILKTLFVFIGIIFLILYWKQGVNNLVLGIISYFSILDILKNELSMAKKFTIHNIEIDSMISTSVNLGSINTDFLENLQSKIFSRRKSCFNVPSFIHKLKSIKLNSNYNRDN